MVSQPRIRFSYHAGYCFLVIFTPEPLPCGMNFERARRKKSPNNKYIKSIPAVPSVILAQTIVGVLPRQHERVAFHAYKLSMLKATSSDIGVLKA